MGRRPLLWRLLTKAILKRAATLFVHSQFEVDTLRRIAGPPDCAKIRIIPFHQIASDRPQQPWARRNRTILFMGPVLSRKPVEPLIHLIKADEKRSFRYVLRRMDNTDSDARAFLESQPNVDIGYGYLKDEEYYRLFSESALVILTHNRLFEGELSGLFCDAIASGTPIIALDMSPHNEFFTRFGEMGFLADYAGDPQWHKRILASGLEALYDGFQRSMAKCRESCGIESIRKVLCSALMQKT
jgi:glycosyltransferase involved in cell wall biosynthesis